LERCRVNMEGKSTRENGTQEGEKIRGGQSLTNTTKVRSNLKDWGVGPASQGRWEFPGKNELRTALSSPTVKTNMKTLKSTGTTGAGTGDFLWERSKGKKGKVHMG